MSEPTGDDRAREAVETVYRSDSRRVLATLIRLACPHCGGRLRLIATLDDPAVIRKILEHLGVGPSEPSPGPAPPKSGAATP